MLHGRLLRKTGRLRFFVEEMLVVFRDCPVCSGEEFIFCERLCPEGDHVRAHGMQQGGGIAGEMVCALKGVEGGKFEDGVHAGADGPSGARPFIKKGRLAPLHESTAHDSDEGGSRMGFLMVSIMAA